MSVLDANADGLVGPTHNYAGLSPGNLASRRNAGAVSSPRAAALQGLAKMRRLADLGLPQLVLPPHERPDIGSLRGLGFGGSDAAVLEAAWRQAPEIAAAACSASAMWAANAATVTASADSRDARVHVTPANLVSNLHRSLEAGQTARALAALLPDRKQFLLHAPLPSQASFADEGAANHVRLVGEGGRGGVDLLVWGRDGSSSNLGVVPTRQTRQASEAIARRHGIARPVLARQSARAVEAGAFHNDVVCVGAGACLFHHEAAFEDTAVVHDAVRRAADGLFEPVLVEVADAELPLADAISTYLFNSQLLQVPGEDRLLLLAPVDVRENARARAVAESLPTRNRPIGRVEYVDVRESMANGGGPACLRLRLPLTKAELAAVNPRQRLTPDLHTALTDWVERRYRNRLAPADLADPALIEETRAALDELSRILGLGGDFYPFQT